MQRAARVHPPGFATTPGRRLLAAVLGCAIFLFGVSATAQDSDDLSTPRRAVTHFIEAANRGDWAAASAVLEGSAAPASKRQRALELSQKLAYLLSHAADFDIDEISDAPAGKPQDGEDAEQVASLRFRGGRADIVLRRLQTAPLDWVFSAGTLARVPELYGALGPSRLEARMPPALRQQTLGMARWQWLGLLTAVFLAFSLGHAIAYVGTRIASRIAARTRVLWDDELVAAMAAPSRLFASIVIFVPLAVALNLPSLARLICWRASTTLGLAALAWSAIRIVGVISNLVERRAAAGAAGTTGTDELLRTRGVQTQVRVLRRVVTVVLAVCAAAVMLMQFEIVRNVGVSLLASAGVAGVVLGLAAQRTLGSLFAGIQLSVTQPIRIGDDVTVEGEFGAIEEITLTYVVVKLWDERRLIVPMTRFLEQPFLNLSKVSSQLHGAVMLYADWSLPVQAVRDELDRLLTDNPLWDGRTKAVHVTDAKERTLELRILVSAANGGNLFNLRAQLREHLVTWLSQFDAGRHLPRSRVEGLDAESARPAQPGLASTPPPESQRERQRQQSRT